MQSVLVPSQLRLIPLLSTTLVHVVFVAAFTAAGYMAVQSRHAAVTPLSMFLFVLTVHSANVNVAEGYCISRNRRVRKWFWLGVCFLIYLVEFTIVSPSARWSQLIVYVLTCVNMTLAALDKSAQATSTHIESLASLAGVAWVKEHRLVPFCKEAPAMPTAGTGAAPLPKDSTGSTPAPSDVPIGQPPSRAANKAKGPGSPGQEVRFRGSPNKPAAEGAREQEHAGIDIEAPPHKRSE